MEGSQTAPAKEPLLKPVMLSHGTVECRDIEAAKRFYSEVLGMETIRTSKISLMLRLNSVVTIAAVQTRGPNGAGHYSHFGFDFETREDVDDAWKKLKGVVDEYGIRKITKPADQHGTYAFYIEDMDGNWWEFLTNPPGGYSYVFEMDEDERAWRDQNMGADRAERYERKTKD